MIIKEKHEVYDNFSEIQLVMWLTIGHYIVLGSQLFSYVLTALVSNIST